MGAKLLSSWRKIKRYSFMVVGIIVALITLFLTINHFGLDWTGFTGGYAKITTTNTIQGITTTIEKPQPRVVCQLLCKISASGCLVDEAGMVSLLKCKLRTTA